VSPVPVAQNQILPFRCTVMPSPRSGMFIQNCERAEARMFSFFFFSRGMCAYCARAIFLRSPLSGGDSTRGINCVGRDAYEGNWARVASRWWAIIRIVENQPSL